MISGYVRGAVREVFSTMLGLEAISNEDVDDKVTLPVNIEGLSGSVSFAGKMDGILYLNFSEQMAKGCSAQILGSDPATITDEEVSDVIGELTNMVSGNLKSKMTDRGYNCQLSIPSVMRSSQISIKSTKSSIEVYNEFKVDSLSELVKVYVFARLEDS
jgi:chemotaxis protein CheX